MPTPDKPAKVSLNLDTLEREGEIKEPFAVAIGAGRPIVFADPMEIEWSALITMLDDPSRFLDFAITDAADRKRIVEGGLPAWKMQKLSRSYMEHYGLIKPGEARASLS